MSEPEHSNLMNESTAKAICEKHLVHYIVDNEPARTLSGTTLVISLSHHPKVIPVSFEEDDQLGGSSVIPHLTAAELMEKQ